MNVTRINHEALLYHSENLLDLQIISLEAFNRIFIGKYHNFLIQNEIIFELDWNATTWLKGVHLRLYSLIRSLGPHKWGRFLFKALWLQTHAAKHVLCQHTCLEMVIEGRRRVCFEDLSDLLQVEINGHLESNT